MKLKELYSANSDRTLISFEVYPPKDDFSGEKLKQLFYHLKILKKYSPSFISLTHGAGGSIQNFSGKIVEYIQQDLKLNVVPHFTCVGATNKNVDEFLKLLEALQVESMLALRGDIPDGFNNENANFRYASELVEYIKANSNLSLGVAGYPEGHIESYDYDADIDFLTEKVNHGADVIFTQMFLDNEKFYRFKDKLRQKNINIPIIAGILPIRSTAQLEKMISMARVTIPKKLQNNLEKFRDDKISMKQIGVDFAVQQCQDLMENGIDGLHFFTLNTSNSLCEILDAILM